MLASAQIHLGGAAGSPGMADAMPWEAAGYLNVLSLGKIRFKVLGRRLIWSPLRGSHASEHVCSESNCRGRAEHWALE